MRGWLTTVLARICLDMLPRRSPRRGCSIPTWCRGPVTINGCPGLIAISRGRPLSLLSVSVRGDRIVEVDILADPQRLNRLDLSWLKPN